MASIVDTTAKVAGGIVGDGTGVAMLVGDEAGILERIITAALVEVAGIVDAVFVLQELNTTAHIDML